MRRQEAEKNTDGLDTVKEVARTLGIQLGPVPNEGLLTISRRIKDLRLELRKYQIGEVSPLAYRARFTTEDILTSEFAGRINACVQELPSNTLIADLKYWREHPYLLPDWTSLMLKLSTKETVQLGTMLNSIIRSDIDANLRLGDLASGFNIDKVHQFGLSRKLFFDAAFQSTSPQAELLILDQSQITEELTKRGIVKVSSAHQNSEAMNYPAAELTEYPSESSSVNSSPQQAARYSGSRIKRKSKLIERDTNEKHELRQLDRELWDYATKNDLFPKIISSRRATSEELTILREYFEGK